MSLQPELDFDGGTMVPAQKELTDDELREHISAGRLLPYAYAFAKIEELFGRNDPDYPWVHPDTFYRWSREEKLYATIGKEGTPIEAPGFTLRHESGDYYLWRGENFKTNGGLQIQGLSPRNSRGMLLVPFGTNGKHLFDVIKRCKIRRKKRNQIKGSDTK